MFFSGFELCFFLDVWTNPLECGFWICIRILVIVKDCLLLRVCCVVHVLVLAQSFLRFVILPSGWYTHSTRTKTHHYLQSPPGDPSLPVPAQLVMLTVNTQLTYTHSYFPTWYFLYLPDLSVLPRVCHIPPAQREPFTPSRASSPQYHGCLAEYSPISIFIKTLNFTCDVSVIFGSSF